MTKVLWFSRHAMSKAQRADLEKALGAITVTQCNGTAPNVHVPFEGVTPEVGETIAEEILLGTQKPLKELVKGFDEVAVVLPINMIQQLLPFSNGRLLQANNLRVAEGDGFKFVHNGWQEILGVEIISNPL